MPSTRKSSAYFASPVTLATTSCGMKSWPSSLCAMVDLLEIAGRAHDGVQVVVVGAATAEVAGHRMARFLAAGLRVLLQQRYSGHYLPGCAEATLRRQFVHEGLLHRMQLAGWTAQSFHGDDL